MTWLEFVQAVALTLLFVMGSIFKPLRSRGPRLWQELAGCPLCLGWWIGAVGAILGHPGVVWWLVPAWGALVGVAALGAHRVLELLDAARHELDLLAKALEKRDG